MQFEITADNVRVAYKGLSLRPRKRLRELALLVGDVNAGLVNSVAEATIAAAMDMIEVPDDLGGLE